MKKQAAPFDEVSALNSQALLIAGYFAVDTVLSLEQADQISELQVKKVLQQKRSSFFF
jgi:hypothetical protein